RPAECRGSPRLAIIFTLFTRVSREQPGLISTLCCRATRTSAFCSSTRSRLIRASGSTKQPGPRSVRPSRNFLTFGGSSDVLRFQGVLRLLGTFVGKQICWGLHGFINSLRYIIRPVASEDAVFCRLYR